MSKILIVDDQQSNLMILDKYLTVNGFKTITANKAKEGLRLAIEEFPDLILLDVMMPEMNGYEVCKAVTENKATSRIPILMVTAKESSEDVAEGFRAGAFDYIKKPFDRTELLTRINAALKFAQSQRVLIEAEKVKTFTATVVTTNHKIKQPLTIINLSTAALRRELGKPEYQKEALLKRIEYIESAVNEITSAINQLNAVERPQLTDYVSNIKMIELDAQKLKDA